MASYLYIKYLQQSKLLKELKNYICCALQKQHTSSPWLVCVDYLVFGCCLGIVIIALSVQKYPGLNDGPPAY